LETAFYQLVVRFVKVLDKRETALGAFLDIERAFNNNRYDSMCEALVRHHNEYTIVRWIKAALEGRVAAATVNQMSLRFVLSRDSLRVVYCRHSYGAWW
jgi:hypothetical protein